MNSLTSAIQNKPSNRILIIVAVGLTLAAVGYGYYSLTHYSIDAFTIPNPARNLHQQKPISTSDIPQLPQQ